MIYRVMGMTDGEMIEKHSITEARRNLTKLVREAEGGKTMALTRRGNPVAVLVSRRTFERLAAGRQGFVEAYGAFVGTVDLPELALDPDELFGGMRDTEPGCDVRL